MIQLAPTQNVWWEKVISDLVYPLPNRGPPRCKVRQLQKPRGYPLPGGQYTHTQYTTHTWPPHDGLVAPMQDTAHSGSATTDIDINYYKMEVAIKINIELEVLPHSSAPIPSSDSTDVW